MTKRLEHGSESGTVSQRYGSTDPDPGPDSYQNATDPEHCLEIYFHLENRYKP